MCCASPQGIRLKAPTLGTLQTLPDCESDNPFSSSVGEVAGFSLHAGVATKANERATKSPHTAGGAALSRSKQLKYIINKFNRLHFCLIRVGPMRGRLKRVFDIDITTCSECGGDVKIIASIENPAVIQKILAHLDDNATSAASALLPDCRASPTVGLFV